MPPLRGCAGHLALGFLGLTPQALSFPPPIWRGGELIHQNTLLVIDGWLNHSRWRHLTTARRHEPNRGGEG